MTAPNLPPALVVGALYDSFLQAALRQFFSRATFETEPMLSASSDGRLAIEPSEDPCVMYVRWFGTRYRLRVPERRLQVRTAQHAAELQGPQSDGNRREDAGKQIEGTKAERPQRESRRRHVLRRLLDAHERAHADCLPGAHRQE